MTGRTYDFLPLSNGAVQVMAMRCLLWDVCVRLGFCGGEYKATIYDMLDAVPVTAAKFANMILTFEGCDLDHRCRTNLEGMFGEMFGDRFAPKITESERIALGLD